MKAAGTRKYALLPILAQRKSQEILPVSTSKQNNTTCTARGKRNLTDNIFSQPQKPLTKVSLNMTSDHIWPHLTMCRSYSSSHVIPPVIPPVSSLLRHSIGFFDLGVFIVSQIFWPLDYFGSVSKKKGCKVARCCTPRVFFCFSLHVLSLI